MSFLNYNKSGVYNMRGAYTRGFTMIELVVTMAIFTLMLGIALSNYRSFSTNALFANDAESIALALREAQIYGTGVRGVGSSFDVAYGVHLEEASPKQFVLFADTVNPNGTYDDGEALPEGIYKLTSGASITDVFCGGVNTCTSVDITFKRPKPEAKIFSGETSYNSASVQLTMNGKTSQTTITQAGQISVSHSQQ